MRKAEKKSENDLFFEGITMNDRIDLEIVISDFENLCNDDIHCCITKDYDNEKTKERVLKIAWSWTHLLKYDPEKLKEITKGCKIIVSGNTCHDFEYRNDNLFRFTNTNITIVSQKMLDYSFEIIDNEIDLFFLLDNYVLGSTAISNRFHNNFNTKHNRNKIFESPYLKKEIVEFINAYRCSIIGSEVNTGIRVDEFISKEAAEKALETIVNIRSSKYDFFKIAEILFKSEEIKFHFLVNKIIELLTNNANFSLGNKITILMELQELYMKVNNIGWKEDPFKYAESKDEKRLLQMPNN
jgi:hypothetical protein